MSYLQRNRSKKTWTIFIVTTCIVLVCILSAIFLRSIIGTIVNTVIGPGTVIRSYEEMSVSFIKSLLLSKYKLQENIKKLESENASLKDKISQIEDIELLNGLSSSDEIVAHVTMRPPYSPYDSLTISKGSSDGIRVGARVFPVGRMVPIGVVKEVNVSTAVVELFSSSGRTFPVMIGTSTEEWLSEGRGGGMFETRVPRSYRVREGDNVFIPKETSLPFTVVYKTFSSEDDPFQRVRFLLPVSFGSLDKVSVQLSQ